MNLARSIAISLGVGLTAGVCSAPSAWAQGPPDPGIQLAAQRTALRPLAALDGLWRGSARIQGMDGKWQELTQTERVGATLDSTVRLIEGRGYDADGKPVFHALATLGYNTRQKAYQFRSYARGEVGDFEFAPTDSGFVWEVKTPLFTMRYTATVRDGRWREVGDRVVAGREPVRFLEMDLRRIGDTDWPAGGAVPPR